MSGKERTQPNPVTCQLSLDMHKAFKRRIAALDMNANRYLRVLIERDLAQTETETESAKAIPGPSPILIPFIPKREPEKREAEFQSQVDYGRARQQDATAPRRRAGNPSKRFFQDGT